MRIRPYSFLFPPMSNSLTVRYLHYEELGLRKIVVHINATCNDLLQAIASDAYPKPHSAALTIWRPQTPLSGLATPNELRVRFKTSKPVEQTCTRIDLTMFVRDLLESKYESPQDDCVPIVSFSGRVSIAEVSESPGLLVSAFHQSVLRVEKERPPRPCACAQSRPGGDTNGRDLSMVTTPVELYHPAFLHFLQDVETNALSPSPEILADTVGLMTSIIANSSSPSQKESAMDQLLAVLGISRGFVPNGSDPTPSPSSVILYPSTPRKAALAAIVIEGLKFGSSNDPTAEVFYVYKKLWAQPERRRWMESSSSPTFLIALTGSWLCIYGAIWTTKPIIQRLTDMMWLGVSPLLNENKLSRIAGTLSSARQGIDTLKHFYEDLELGSPSLNDKHPRFYPSVTTYPCPRRPGKHIEFEYVEPMEKETHICVTYRARTTPSPYADEGTALETLLSKLFYRGPLSPNSELSMVVMDYFPSETLTSISLSMEICDEVYLGVKKALDVLHEAGFVFGDLRRSNVLVQRGGGYEGAIEGESGEVKVVLVNFARAGRAGIARYPAFLTSMMLYPEGAGPWKEIRKEHDDWMLESLRRPVEC
ncbi:hypothetical protein D9758_005788 [Tetrapyrgos nigripes]|uniref:Protein kinase domain-containing protein n=1 Tax=Tetrapyrgos nigripes TaxID=182062 RepID=A0A8H5GK48_9AGAR|nr:hypothetical protein D9758_005788 [Tetrapyrgos nigripes]